MSLDELTKEIRGRLPLLRAGVALNHAGIAPQPLSDSIAAFEKRRAELLPSEACSVVKAVRDRARAQYAGLLHVAPDEIAFTKHTAEGVNLLAHGFPWKPGDRILTVSVEYPSNVYPWWNIRNRGVEIVSVAERDGRVDLDEFFSAMDGRTRMVAISHVEFASGFAFDLAAVSRECRSRGIFLFVDIAQSFGAIPVDLSLVDAAGWPTWKWLMGPIGMGGFYLAKRHLETIPPVFVGPDGMVPRADYLDYNFEFLPGAARFEYSTENLLGLIGTADALDRQARAWQSGGAVTERIMANVDALARGLEPLGYRLFSSTRQGERSGIASFRSPGDPAADVAKLKAAGIDAAARGGRLRLSPHFYNTPEDCDRVVRALR